MKNLTKDDKIRIAKAFTAYYQNLKDDDTDDLKEYNEVEIIELRTLANEMELPYDYLPELI